MTEGDFSPAELLIAYAVRKGYVEEGTNDYPAAGRALEKHEPDLVRVLQSPGPYESDPSRGHWPDFLDDPPALIVEGEEIVLTEHGQNLAYRWQREQKDE